MLERNFPFFNAGFLVALLAAGGIFSIALAGADKNYFVLEGRLTFPEPMQKLPRPGAIVLRPTDHSAGLTAQSDLKGKFRLKKVPSGRYMLEAMVGRQWMARMSVMVSPGLADKNRIIAVEVAMELPSNRDSRYRTTISIDGLQKRSRGTLQGRWLLIEANREDLKGNPAKAKKLLEKALQQSPDFSEALNVLGTLYHAERRYDRSIELFRKALVSEPDFFEPQVNLGGSLLAAGRFVEAERENRHAVEMRPNDPLANAQLGISLLRLNRNAESLDFLHKAAEEDPHSPTRPALFLADALILTGQPTAAAETLESYLRNHPDDPELAKIRNSIALLRNAVSTPPSPRQYF